MSTGQSFPSSGVSPSLCTRQQYTTENLIVILWFYLLFLMNCQQEQHASPFATNIWLSAFLLSSKPSVGAIYFIYLYIIYFCQGERPAAERDSQESELVPFYLLCQMVMFTHIVGRDTCLDMRDHVDVSVIKHHFPTSISNNILIVFLNVISKIIN